MFWFTVIVEALFAMITHITHVDVFVTYHQLECTATVISAPVSRVASGIYFGH